MLTPTPGPWRYLSGSHGIYASDEKAIALVYGARKGPDEIRDANARLIAAAPDLLEALQLVAGDEWGGMTGGEMSRAIDKARAAIAKATGATS